MRLLCCIHYVALDEDAKKRTRKKFNLFENIHDFLLMSFHVIVIVNVITKCCLSVHELSLNNNHFSVLSDLSSLLIAYIENKFTFCCIASAYALHATLLNVIHHLTLASKTVQRVKQAKYWNKLLIHFYMYLEWEFLFCFAQRRWNHWNYVHYGNFRCALQRQRQ